MLLVDRLRRASAMDVGIAGIERDRQLRPDDVRRTAMSTPSAGSPSIACAAVEFGSPVRRRFEVAVVDAGQAVRARRRTLDRCDAG